MMGAHSPLSLRRRTAIETEIEHHLGRVEILIARLDRDDAPFEDMEEDDHSGDPLDKGEEDDLRRHFPKPVYGLDQTTGPINYLKVQQEHYARENGIVRTARGGWRRQ